MIIASLIIRYDTVYQIYMDTSWILLHYLLNTIRMADSFTLLHAGSTVWEQLGTAATPAL